MYRDNVSNSIVTGYAVLLISIVNTLYNYCSFVHYVHTNERVINVHKRNGYLNSLKGPVGYTAADNDTMVLNSFLDKAFHV